MNELTETEKAWLAGFFDGEGCVFIGCHKKQGAVTPQHYLAIIFAQSDYDVLKLWRDRVGIGRLYELKREKKHHKSKWAWRISDKQAEALLKWMLPYLHVKQREAEIGIEFQDTKYSRDAHRATPRAIIDMRENYRRVLMALKHGQPVEMQEVERWRAVSECQMSFWA